MTVELRPLGVKCNIKCTYCYQEPMRDAGNVPHQYDIEKMKAGVERLGGPFSMFGGEPLLLPLRDLEELFRWGLEKYKSNGIQTNGSLITPSHVEMFIKYKVQVGVSVDGPGELNDVRWAGTLDRTRKTTANTMAAIEMLCDRGHAPSIIVTLHKANATADRLPVLADWLRYLDGRGVKHARLHALETESVEIRAKYALSADESVAAMIYFAGVEKDMRHMKFDVFKDMRSMLRGDDRETTCVWNACDSYTTRAVQGIEGSGQRSNCGRTNKDGIDFVKSEREGFERYIALYNTPWEFGGCQGCRFFLQCKGQCPGTAIGGDWRNRTEDCEVWMKLLEFHETEMVREGVQPISLHPERAKLEAIVVSAWVNGENMYVHQALAALERDGSTAEGGEVVGPNAHGDSHGDGHGDHADQLGAQGKGV